MTATKLSLILAPTMDEAPSGVAARVEVVPPTTCPHCGAPLRCLCEGPAPNPSSEESRR